MAKKKADHRLPCIGIWSRLKLSEPTAGNTLVGLWIDDDGEQRIEFFCAFYVDKDGTFVDPDELRPGDEYSVTYRSRQGGTTAFWEEDIDPPDYWAEARWLIPGWGGA